MNLKEEKYAKYYLVQEMMGTVPTVAKFNPDCSKFVADSVRRTGGIFFSGEGSSRLLPAKNARRTALTMGCDVNVQIDGSHQAELYDLSRFSVLIDSNSGRTKEALMLARKLQAEGHKETFALSANPDTPIRQACVDGHVLGCGWEEAVAATKSVVEQGLFCESVIWHLAGKDMKSALKGLPEKLETALTLPVPAEIVEWVKGAHTIYFSGYNDGVAEELTLKTNEITRRKSDFLEGTYAVHGIEEVMQEGDIVFLVDPIECEYDKFLTVFKGAGVHVVAISTKQTPFERTIVVPDAGALQPYVYLCAGWNILVEVGISDGINLDKPERARKVGNEM
ncbi:MAG: sugar isomerase [Bacteroidales bacterium]|jgi:glucosamine--fructose-6-phosphate aminotransferase (isomerizing)|nr:sugar isomerase [Bacteroidales bacterium]